MTGKRIRRIYEVTAQQQWPTKLGEPWHHYTITCPAEPDFRCTAKSVHPMETTFPLILVEEIRGDFKNKFHDTALRKIVEDLDNHIDLDRDRDDKVYTYTVYT